MLSVCHMDAMRSTSMADLAIHVPVHRCEVLAICQDSFGDCVSFTIDCMAILVPHLQPAFEKYGCHFRVRYERVIYILLYKLGGYCYAPQIKPNIKPIKVYAIPTFLYV